MWGKVLVGVFLALALGVGLTAALGIEVVSRQAIADDPQSDAVATFDEVALAHDALFGAHVHDTCVDWTSMGADPVPLRPDRTRPARTPGRDSRPGPTGTSRAAITAISRAATTTRATRSRPR